MTTTTHAFLCLGALCAVLVLAAQPLGGAEAASGGGRTDQGLSRWLRFQGEERIRTEFVLGSSYQQDASDVYWLNRLRIGAHITPLDWLRFLVEGQDSRLWGAKAKTAPASCRDSLDLRQALVEVGRSEGNGFGLHVGRQALTFGEGRLVADSGWSNVGRTFDAVRLTARRNGLRVDAFAASVVQVKTGEFNRRQAGNNLHGLYGQIDRLVPRSRLEPYILWRVSRGLKGETGRAGNLDSKTIGFRWAGKLPRRLDYNVETARQLGDTAGDPIAAWAGHWAAGYTVSSGERKPRLSAEYDYGSGDRNPADGRRGAFDQLYPSSHDKFGLADQLMWSNMHYAQAALEVPVRRKVRLKGAYGSLWLAERRDGLYRNGRLFVRVASGSAGRHIGEELDLQVFWNSSQKSQVNAGYARVLPGRFLKLATPGVPFNYSFLSFARQF